MLLQPSSRNLKAADQGDFRKNISWQKIFGMATSIFFRNIENYFLPISFVFLSASQRCLPTPLARAPSCGIYLHSEDRTAAFSLALFTQRFFTKFYRNRKRSLRFFHSCKNEYVPTLVQELKIIEKIQFLCQEGGGQAKLRNFGLIVFPFIYNKPGKYLYNRDPCVTIDFFIKLKNLKIGHEAPLPF